MADRDGYQRDRLDRGARHRAGVCRELQREVLHDQQRCEGAGAGYHLVALERSICRYVILHLATCLCVCAERDSERIDGIGICRPGGVLCFRRCERVLFAAERIGGFVLLGSWKFWAGGVQLVRDNAAGSVGGSGDWPVVTRDGRSGPRVLCVDQRQVLWLVHERRRRDELRPRGDGHRCYEQRRRPDGVR